MTTREAPETWWIVGDDKGPDRIPYIEIAAGEMGTESYVEVCQVTGEFDGEDTWTITPKVRERAALIACAPALSSTVDSLVAALRPIVEAHEKAADQIGDSDLDNEQPRGVWVTLGDFRRARAALSQAAMRGEGGK